MVEQGQTEANYNLRNTNEIDHKVGERREEEKGRSKIGDVCVLKDFRNAIKYLEIYLKISKEVGDRAGQGKRMVILATPMKVLEISRKP